MTAKEPYCSPLGPKFINKINLLDPPFGNSGGGTNRPSHQQCGQLFSGQPADPLSEPGFFKTSGPFPA